MSDLSKDQREYFGHPAGLYVLFFTEMWERFSYYGMRTLLVLYMTQHLFVATQSGAYVFGYDHVKHFLEMIFGPMAIQPFSSQIYGLYTGFVYFTPLFGGIIADRLWGFRKTVVVGAVLMAIGHFLMAIESMFFLALLFLIFGNGCFKPNISVQVGSLYPEGDPRRDRAFTIFYMGVNLGAFFSPLICGTLGQVYGWHYGFGAAGVGMLVGLCIYLWGQKYLSPESQTHHEHKKQSHTPLTTTEWKALIGLCAVCALNIAFWGVYEQQGNTLQIFADKNTDWTVFGLTMPSTWFQSLNPAFIFMFAPMLNSFWGWQSKRKTEPTSISKMALGCLVLGGSFIILMYVVKGMSVDTRISFLWLVLCTFLYTVGELYLSPIGLSLVTKVAPKRILGMMMGVWFLSSFFGNYLSGYLGMYYETLSKESFFFMLGCIGIASGLLIFALQRPIKKAIGHNV